jgi:hypothetical protein
MGQSRHFARGDASIHVRSTPNASRKFNAPMPVAMCLTGPLGLAADREYGQCILEKPIIGARPTLRDAQREVEHAIDHSFNIAQYDIISCGTCPKR